MSPKKRLKRIIPTQDDLRVMAKERAIFGVFDIVLDISTIYSKRDAEDVVLEALRRWRDKDIF